MLEVVAARAAMIFAGHGLKIAAVVGITVAVATCDRTRMSAAVERGKEQVRVQIEKNTDANAKKADAARRDAQRLPANRLCDKYARDC